MKKKQFTIINNHRVYFCSYKNCRNLAMGRTLKYCDPHLPKEYKPTRITSDKSIIEQFLSWLGIEKDQSE